MIKIGIVLPTYKRMNLLKRAIESILNQSYDRYIICVVEDCSPDDTYKLMQNYQKNKKIHYIRLHQNQGVNVARNKAIEYLTSATVNCEYITMLDDDDYFTPNTFKEADKIISQTHANWLTFNRIYPNGKKITKSKKYGYLSYLEDKYSGTTVTGDAVDFISKELIRGKYYEKTLRAREYLFFLLLGNESLMYVHDFDAVVCEYLPDGMTHSQPRATKEEHRIIRDTEQKILHSIGLSYELVEYKKSKSLLIEELNKKSSKKIFKYLRHTIKWKIRLFFRNNIKHKQYSV